MRQLINLSINSVTVSAWVETNTEEPLKDIDMVRHLRDYLESPQATIDLAHLKEDTNES